MALLKVSSTDDLQNHHHHDDENVLQKHVAFFDRNHDGVIYPWETFQGLRAIGAGILLSSFAAVFINAGLSRKTRPGKFPSLLFPIEIKNIEKAKHTSDSGVYDTEGRFVATRFEEMFNQHALTYPDALTGDELKALLHANRVPKDYLGWVAAYAEWKVLYILGKDENGLLKKDSVRGVYDGSLFQNMEEGIRKKKEKMNS
ncbi:probable peroxygenase 4 [Impatiens glandulifera]|uniref:probable peroxygenase 4 n=1 Tax=Impatiens glandulifera TaxID=253017 RepID=UPI001FB10035|nr:probable peroxygenase 4 [Impatiens glandulifera]